MNQRELLLYCNNNYPNVRLPASEERPANAREETERADEGGGRFDGGRKSEERKSLLPPPLYISRALHSPGGPSLFRAPRPKGTLEKTNNKVVREEEDGAGDPFGPAYEPEALRDAASGGATGAGAKLAGDGGSGDGGSPDAGRAAGLGGTPGCAGRHEWKWYIFISTFSKMYS